MEQRARDTYTTVSVYLIIRRDFTLKQWLRSMKLQKSDIAFVREVDN